MTQTYAHQAFQTGIGAANQPPPNPPSLTELLAETVTITENVLQFARQLRNRVELTPDKPCEGRPAQNSDIISAMTYLRSLVSDVSNELNVLCARV